MSCYVLNKDSGDHTSDHGYVYVTDTKKVTVKYLIQDAPNPKTQMFFRLDLQLPLRNILKPGVKWKMKM